MKKKITCDKLTFKNAGKHEEWDCIHRVAKSFETISDVELYTADLQSKGYVCERRIKELKEFYNQFEDYYHAVFKLYERYVPKVQEQSTYDEYVCEIELEYIEGTKEEEDAYI